MTSVFLTCYRQRTCLVLGSVLLCLAGGWSSANAEDLSVASTSRQSREAALQAIPWQKLNAASQQKLAPILKNPALYRRMPVETIRCDHQMQTFLVRNPEVIVNIWQLMGITQVQAKRIGEYLLDTSDGAGTNSQIELVYGTQDLHIYYGEGVYEGPLLVQKVTGSCVILLQSEFGQDESGAPTVTNRMDVFMQVDQVAAKFLAKTLHPLVGKSADYNFVETARFVSRLSDTAQTNPTGIQGLAARLTDCDAARRQEFSALAAASAQRLQITSRQIRAQSGDSSGERGTELK